VLDLNHVLTGVHGMLQRLIGEHIEISIHHGKGLGHVRFNPAQLEQVILNLAINARDAMPTGGSLSIATSNAEIDQEHARNDADAQPGSYVLLTVTDTGIGMDEKTRSRIF